MSIAILRHAVAQFRSRERSIKALRNPSYRQMLEQEPANLVWGAVQFRTFRHVFDQNSERNYVFLRDLLGFVARPVVQARPVTRSPQLRSVPCREGP